MQLRAYIKNILTSRKYEKIVILVDLDGTVTIKSINNTHDFIKLCYRMCFGKPGVYAFKTLFLMMFSFFAKTLKRKVDVAYLLSTSLLLSIFPMSLLRLYAYYWSKIIAKNFINKSVLRFVYELKNLCMSDSECDIVLLTCCIDIPACIIARILNFDYCYARPIMRRYFLITTSYMACPIVKLKVILKIKHSHKRCLMVYIVDRASWEKERYFLKNLVFPIEVQ